MSSAYGGLLGMTEGITSNEYRMAKKEIWNLEVIFVRRFCRLIRVRRGRDLWNSWQVTASQELCPRGKASRRFLQWAFAKRKHGFRAGGPRLLHEQL